MADIFEQLNKSYNDHPWSANDKSSISLRRIHGCRNMGKRMETKLVVVSWLRARLSRMGAGIQGPRTSQSTRSQFPRGKAEARYEIVKMPAILFPPGSRQSF